MKQLMLLLAVFSFACIGTAQAQCPYSTQATTAKENKTAAVKVADVQQEAPKKACSAAKKAACAGKAKATAASGKACAGKAKATAVAGKACAGQKKACCASKAKATTAAAAANAPAAARSASDRSMDSDIRDKERAVPVRAVKTSAGR